MCAAWAYARVGTHTANIGFNADTALFVAAFLRRVTIPVRVKRRWAHYIRRNLKLCAYCDDSIALIAIRHRRSFSGRGEAALHNRATDHTQSNITVDKYC